MELITNSSNIDYKKMFDKENFYYINQRGEVCQHTEIAAFDITEENYNELVKHKANCGRCFICALNAEDETLFEQSDINFENLLGYVMDITTKVFPDSEEYKHYCVEFALPPEKIVETIENNQPIALFYFKNDDVYSDKILVSLTQFKY